MENTTDAFRHYHVTYRTAGGEEETETVYAQDEQTARSAVYAHGAVRVFEVTVS